jgi:flagellar biosynthetic protein FliR
MDDQALAHTLVAWSFAFMLILCRCGAAIMLLPGLAEDGSILMLRMGLALGMTMLLLPAIAPSLPSAPNTIPALAALIGNELLAGGFLGWLARLVALALPASGQIISLSTGMSSVLQPDANFGAQTAGIGRLFGMAAPALLFATGAYRLPLSALAGSYAAWPAGFAPPSSDVVDMVVHGVGAHFALALRLASPFVLLGLVWQTGLGLMSRLVPQLQIYFAALPGQVLGGLLLLSVLAGPLAQIWLQAVEAAYAQLP